MYRLAICDDEQADVAYLQSLLEKWAENTRTALKIESYPSAEAFLFQYEEDKAFDLLYDVEALHYLLKPVTAEKLYAVLDRAAERLKAKEKALCLVLPGTVARVPFHEIRYLEVQRNYVTVYGEEAYTVKKTLNEFAAGSRSVSAVDNVAVAGVVVSVEGMWPKPDFSARLYERFLQGEITAEREQQVYIDELFWNNDIEYCFLDIDGDGSGELQIRDDFAYYVVKIQEGALRVIWEDSPVTEEEFYAYINELIDLSECVEPSFLYSEEEMLELLEDSPNIAG